MAKKPSLPWTLEENEELKDCIERLATYGHLALQSYFLVNLPQHFNGQRTFDEVMDHYLDLLELDDDVSLTENNEQVPLPNHEGPNDPFVSSSSSPVSGAGCRNPVESSSILIVSGVDKQASANVVGGSCNIVSKINDPFVSSSSSPVSGGPPVWDRSSSLLAAGGVDGQGSTSAIANAGGCNIVSNDNQGRKWTLDEHKLFLIGLWKYGSNYRGKWVNISEHILRSRTSRQIGSYGNKYKNFQLRKKTLKHPKKYYSTFLDITKVDEKSLSDLVQKKLLSQADADAYALHLQAHNTANPVPAGADSSQRILNFESGTTLLGVTSFVNQTTIQNPQMQISYPTCEHHFHPRAPQICHIRPEIQDSQNVVEPAGNTDVPELSLEEVFDIEIQDGEHIPFAEVLPHSPDQFSPFVHSDSQHSRHEFHAQQEIIDHQPSWQDFYYQLKQDLQQETQNSPTDSDAQSPQLPSMIIHEISSEDDDPDMSTLEPAENSNHSEESSEFDFEAEVSKLFK